MTDAATSKPAKLTNKQRAFIEQYLIDFNATQAAIRAGYSEQTAAEQGSRLLTNVKVTHAINERFEALKVSANEALNLLSDHARGSLQDFIDSKGNVDLSGAIESGKMHLLKKYKKVRRYFKGELSEESEEIELHDPQAAAVWIGKHHQLFVQRQEVTGKDGGPIEISDARSKLEQLLANGASRTGAPEHPVPTDGPGSGGAAL